MGRKKKADEKEPWFVDTAELEKALKEESKRQEKEIERALLEDREISFDSPVLEEFFKRYG